MTTPRERTGPFRGRSLRAYLLGAGSVLVVESLLFVGLVAVPGSSTVVAGTAHPASAAEASPAASDLEGGETAPPQAQPPRPDPPERSRTAVPDAAATSETSGQRPGTIRLPGGGTAKLVREEVGPDAVLPVPENLDEATWWGAGLGAPSGASVFAGHVDWQGRTGPFAQLWDMRIGERVTITDTDGTVWNYRVTQLVTVHKDQLPARAPELFGQSGAHRIVLVTCGGRWIGGTTGYADNRVVIAEPA